MTTETMTDQRLEMNVARLEAALKRHAPPGVLSTERFIDRAYSGGLEHGARSFVNALAANRPAPWADISAPWVVAACQECGVEARYKAVREFICGPQEDQEISVSALLAFWDRLIPRAGAPRRGKPLLFMPDFHVEDTAAWRVVLREVFEQGAWPVGCKMQWGMEFPAGEVAAAPKPYKVPKKELTPEGAAWMFTSPAGEGRHNLQGVYNDPDGFRVGTNGRQLIVVADKDIPNNDRGKVIRAIGEPEDGTVFPKWRMVMGTRESWMNRPLRCTVRPGDGVMERLGVAAMINKRLATSKDKAHAALYDAEIEGWHVYDPELVYTLLDALFRLGSPSVQLRIRGGQPGGGLMWMGSSKACAVLMPIRHDEATLPECYVKLG